jgi:hypothetical protein
VPWFEPEPPLHEPEREEGEFDPVAPEAVGYGAEQFVVTPNPEIGRIWLPDGGAWVVYERDDRFGFTRWVETPEEYE